MHSFMYGCVHCGVVGKAWELTEYSAGQAKSDMVDHTSEKHSSLALQGGASAHTYKGTAGKVLSSI